MLEEENEIEESDKKTDKKSKKAEDEKIIKRALKAFKACEEADSDNRERALEDLRFARLGEQWPEKVKKEIKFYFVSHLDEVLRIAFVG